MNPLNQEKHAARMRLANRAANLKTLQNRLDEAGRLRRKCSACDGSGSQHGGARCSICHGKRMIEIDPIAREAAITRAREDIAAYWREVEADLAIARRKPETIPMF